MISAQLSALFEPSALGPGAADQGGLELEEGASKTSVGPSEKMDLLYAGNELCEIQTCWSEEPGRNCYDGSKRSGEEKRESL